MSEENGKFYEKNHTIGLVTNASYINQNIALLVNEDYYKADSLAVSHEGFINYIPLVNTMRRCKYVPIRSGCDRGKGLIKWMRWVKLNKETYFVCLSTLGIQFFDIELTDLQFEYDFKELNCRMSLPLGACVLNGLLFVGIAMGMVVAFKSTLDGIQLLNTFKVKPFLYMDGYKDCIVTISKEELISYKFIDGTLKHINQQHETLFINSLMKVFQDILVIGDRTGVITLFSLPLLNPLTKKKIHDGEITGMDYSNEKQIFLTVSDDLTLKAWKWIESRMNLECIFEINSDDDKPFCGISFTNRTCTEFCCVKSNSLVVSFYVETHEKIEEEEGGNSEDEQNNFYTPI